MCAPLRSRGKIPGTEVAVSSHTVALDPEQRLDSVILLGSYKQSWKISRLCFRLAQLWRGRAVGDFESELIEWP